MTPRARSRGPDDRRRRALAQGGEPTRAAPLAPWAAALLAAWALALVLAPPLSTSLWALNGFRSLALERRLVLLAGAATSGLLVMRVRRRAVWAAAALGLTLALAIPL